MDLDDLPASVRDRPDNDSSDGDDDMQRQENSSSQQPTEPPSPFLGKRDVDESIHALDIEQTQLDAARPESQSSSSDNHSQSDHASDDEEARDRVGIELQQTIIDHSPSTSSSAHSSTASSPKVTKTHFLGPSPSLQRQVAEAQAAAVKLAKEQEQKQQSQSSKSVEWNEERKELVSSQNMRPSTTTSGVETVESMQVLGRVVSVLSINNELSCCDTSSDGSLFVQACGRVAHIWFTPSMRHALQLNSSANGGHVVHQSPLRLVKFTPFDPIMHAETGCGFHLLTVGDDMKMVLWNLTNGKLIRIFLGHKDLIFDAYFARTCDLLFTSSADGNLLCWDWKYSGNLLGSYAKETGGIHSISILEDFHKVLLSTPHDGCTHIWDINLQQRIASIEPDQIWKKKYQPMGATNGGWIDAQRFHTGRVLVVRASPDQTTLATGSADSTVKLWNILNLRRDHASVMAAKQAKPVKRSHLIPFTYNNEPAADSNDFESGIYNPSSNSSYPSSSYNPYVPSESSTHYTSSNLDGEESPLSEEGYHASLLHTLRHEGEVHAVEWTPDSAFIISASRDCTVRVWMAEMGKLLYQVNLPTAILTMNFTYNPHLFEAPITSSSSDKNPDSPSSKSRNFYLGRLHVALKSRVLVMDLSVLESLVKVPKEGAAGSSSSTSSSTTKPSTAPTKPKKRKPSSRASHHHDNTPSEPVQLVASDALVSQFLPGADRVRALFAADRPVSSPAGSDPDALMAMASRLEFAPSFLHQLLSSPMGSGVSRETLADNMRYFGLTSTFLLRIISNTIHFKPNQILLGFAKPRPECNPLFKLAFGGVPIDSAMIDMGFFPSKVQLSPGAGGATAAFSNRQAGSSKPDPHGVMSADSAKVYEPPSNLHATAEGVEGTPAAASETVRKEGRHQPFHFIAGSAAYGDNAEGFFYALTDPSLVAPHVTPSSEVGQKSLDPDANFSEGLIHWEPATQLNLLAHLSSNAPIAPVHAESALDENHVKYPLFGMGRKDAADEREKLELRRRGTLADPYGGSRALQQNNLTENAKSIAHTLAKDRAVPSNRREMKMAKASVIGTNPIAAPTTGTVFKGITLPLSAILDPARHFAGAPHFDPTASTSSLHNSGSVYALSSVASTAQLDSHVASLSEKEFASFVSGQVVPNGERIVGRALVEKSGSEKDSKEKGKIKDHFPRRNESMQFDDLPGTPRTRAHLEDAMSLRRDAALDHSVAIPLRKSIGLKPVSNTLDAESGRKLLGIKQSGPGARIESRVTLDVSDVESLGDAHEMHHHWNEASSTSTGKSGEDPFSPFGKRTFHKPSRREARMSVKHKLSTFDVESSAPVSLNVLLETFSATEIERQTKLSLDTLHLHAAVPTIVTSADKIAEAGKTEVTAIEKDRTPRVGKVLQSTRGNLMTPSAAASFAANPAVPEASPSNGKKASVYTFAQPSPSPRGGKTAATPSTNLISTTHKGGVGGSFESLRSPGQSQVNTATAQLLRDNDFRQEIRRTLLHQTNTLAALDAEVSLSSSLSGGGGLGSSAPVREYTYSQQQLIAPFGGTGSSGLTLTPHTSAHALVGSGMKETFAIGSNAVLSAHMTGGGVKGFSEEYTASRSNIVTPSLTSPFYQFSNMPQRIFSISTPRSSHGRSGSEKDLSKPSTATKEKEAPEPAAAAPMFPGMREMEARSPQSQARQLSNNPSQSIETQLQKAFPPEKRQKWLNKFSNDVPGLDVIFDAAMPITTLPSSKPSSASMSAGPQTPSSFSSFPSPYTKKSDRLISNDGSSAGSAASTPSFLAASDSPNIPFSPLDLSHSLEAVTEHPKEEGPAAKPKAKHGRRALPAAEAKPKDVGLSVGISVGAAGSQTARPSRRSIIDKSGGSSTPGSMTARGSISKRNNINEMQSARLDSVARGRPVQSAAASRTNISTNSTIETPSFTPQVVSVTPSASILTRPFILRPSDQSSSVASAAAKAAENQAIDLGLDILPDIKALHGPTKVDLDAPKPIHSAAHRAVEIVPSASTEEAE